MINYSLKRSFISRAVHWKTIKSYNYVASERTIFFFDKKGKKK